MKKRYFVIICLICLGICSNVDAGRLFETTISTIPFKSTCTSRNYSLGKYSNNRFIAFSNYYGCPSNIIDKDGKIYNEFEEKYFEYIPFEDGYYRIYKSSYNFEIELFDFNNNKKKYLVLLDDATNVTGINTSVYADDDEHIYAYAYHYKKESGVSVYKSNIFIIDKDLENYEVIEIPEIITYARSLKVINDVIYISGRNYLSTDKTNQPYLLGYDKSGKKIFEFRDLDNELNGFSIEDFVVEDDGSIMLAYSINSYGNNDPMVKKIDKTGKVLFSASIPVDKNAYNTGLVTIGKTKKGSYYYYCKELFELNKNGKVLNKFYSDFTQMEFSGYKNGIEYYYYNANTNEFEQRYIAEKPTLTMNKSNVGGYRVNRKNPRLGETVKITLRIPKKYELDKIELNSDEIVVLTKETDKIFSFVMPDAAVDINVTYKKITK